jgi:hypothetical protein
MAEIPLANGKGIALVDDEHFEELNRYRWSKHACGYAVRSLSFEECRQLSKPLKSSMLMHRQVLGVDPHDDVLVQHLNGDRLDNRRGNLRYCTRAQHAQNARVRRDAPHGFKGVALKRGRYVARVTIDGEKRWVGAFSTPEEAARAYDAAATHYFGRFATLNFPAEEAHAEQGSGGAA